MSLVLTQRQALADRAAPPPFVEILHQSAGVYRGKVVRSVQSSATVEFSVSATLKGVPATTLRLPASFALAYPSASAAKSVPASRGFAMLQASMPSKREVVLVVAPGANSQTLPTMQPLTFFDKTDREYSYVQPVLALLAADERGLPFIENKLTDQQSDEFYWVLRDILDSPAIAAPLRARLAGYMFRNVKRDFWSGYGELTHALMHPSTLPDLITGLQALKSRQTSPLIGAELLGRFKDLRTLPLLATMLDDARIVADVNSLHHLYDAWQNTDPTTYACLMAELAKQELVFGSTSSYTSYAEDISRRVDGTAKANCAAQLATVFPPLDVNATMSAIMQASNANVASATTNASTPSQRSWKRALYFVAVRGITSPAVIQTLVQLLESTKNEEMQQAVADTLVRVARRSDAAQAMVVFDAQLRVLTRAALLFPENGRMPSGMNAKDMGAHQRRMVLTVESIAQLIQQFPALTKELRVRFETAPIRVQSKMTNILSWIATTPTPVTQRQQAFELFALPPAQAPDALLRSLGLQMWLLVGAGAKPTAVMTTLLESQRAIDRHAALVYLGWQHAILPRLRPSVEAMAKSDLDAAVRARAVETAALAWQ